MFRRLWTGLPPTPRFPADLQKLGYFVNEDDEIRNIENPKHYFKYFISRNMYYNDCQRFSFNTAVQGIVLERLETLGVLPVRLPLGTRADEPHVLVLASDGLATAERVLLFVGETAQDLGILAHRVIGGAGGLDKGSVVSLVRRVREMAAAESATRDTIDETDTVHKTGPSAAPAILIANPGELFWWPEAQRALSLPSCEGMPRPSAVHLSPRKVAGQNVIPGHETADAHVTSVFEQLLGPARGDISTVVTMKPPRITAIGIAGGADALEGFLDNEERWRRWGQQIDSLVVLGGLYEEQHIQTVAFRRFLRQRGRAYIASEAPVDTPVATADGNDQAVRATRYGCPVHSAGTTWLTELMFIDAQAAILAWGDAVARTPDYTNPDISVSYAETILTADDTTWANYKDEDYGELGSTDTVHVWGQADDEGTKAEGQKTDGLVAGATVLEKSLGEQAITEETGNRDSSDKKDLGAGPAKNAAEATVRDIQDRIADAVRIEDE